MISDLEKENKTKCPYLQKEGEFFYYCGLTIPVDIKDRKPAPHNPIYQKHLGLAEMQLYCMGNFERCCFYPTISVIGTGYRKMSER